MDEEKKKAAYNYINEYQKKNYDRITILRKSGEKEKLTKIAKEKGLAYSKLSKEEYKEILRCKNFISSCKETRIKYN